MSRNLISFDLVSPKQHARTLLRSIALLALVASLASLAVAQTPTAPAPAPTAVPTQTPPLNGIAHIAIRVKDIAASTAFYNKLGFQQAFANTAADGTVTQAFLKINDKQFIELYPVTAHDPQVGFLHLCFEGADLNALHDFYVAEGLAPIAVRKAGAGNLLFTLKGPEQPAFPQNIEYTQYMPDSRHSKDAGLHLGPNRVADKMVQVSLAMKDPDAARDFYLTKLGFTASKTNSMWLPLPGDSGQQVLIVPATPLGSKSKILLTSPDIRKSGALLQANGIPFTDGNTLSLTDPDGNILMIGPPMANLHINSAAPTHN
jgi:catechol 2,3-dioxygenase-like lactoylglutathione lyase family enzyme